jgi:hypothetical protein
MAEGCVSTNVTLTRQANLTQSLTIPIQLSGTATNGQDYSGVPSSITSVDIANSRISVAHSYSHHEIERGL